MQLCLPQGSALLQGRPQESPSTWQGTLFLSCKHMDEMEGTHTLKNYRMTHLVGKHLLLTVQTVAGPLLTALAGWWDIPNPFGQKVFPIKWVTL